MKTQVVARRRGGRVPAAIWAGLAYFLLLFVAGLAMNLFRVYVLTPVLGASLALLLEFPAMLAIAWMASRNVIDRMGLTRRSASAAVMGALALALLLIGDLGVSLVLGSGVAEHFARYLGLPGMIGLASELVWCVVPFVQVTLAESRAR